MAGRCGATLRRKPGRFCTSYPLTGTTRCRLHGGQSLAGPANGNWKHGMYSTVLHGALGAHYATARQNPALVALTEQIALVDAKVFEPFEQVQRGRRRAGSEQPERGIARRRNRSRGLTLTIRSGRRSRTSAMACITSRT